MERKELLEGLRKLSIVELEVLVDQINRIINEERSTGDWDVNTRRNISVPILTEHMRRLEEVEKETKISRTEIFERALQMYFSDETHFVSSLRWAEPGAKDALIEKIIVDNGYRELVAEESPEAATILVFANHHMEVAKEVMTKLRNEVKTK